MASIQFLGTGGGRFVILSQRRYTGGMWIEADGANFLVDPGPGALIRCLEFKKDLRKLDAILVSHNHLDHYNDAEICVEGMTAAMNKRRGFLMINENVSPYISEYHQSAVDVVKFSSAKEFKIAGVGIETLPTFDHDDAFGFKFHTKEGAITYSSDTNYDDSLINHYKDSKVLILNVLRPTEKKIHKHLCTGEAEKLIAGARPEKAVLQHFGMIILNIGPDNVARGITKKTGIETIAAKDGMVVELGEKKTKREQQSLSEFQ